MARRVPKLKWLRNPGWWVSFLSIASLGLTQAGIKFTSAGGTLAPALFLALWLGHAIARPAQALDRMLTRRLPYAMPLLAIASTFWAADPSRALRGGLEFLITIAVATYAAATVAAPSFVSGTMLAVLLQVVFSLLSGVQQDVVYAGNEALTGLFGSKNYMGYIGALLGLLSLATVADRRNATLLRLAALAGFTLGCMVVIRARSADALLAFAMGLTPLVYVLMLGLVPRRVRVLMNGACGCLAVIGAAIAYDLKDELMDMVLTATGKDAGLTGRTYLWEHASQFISLHPLYGLGYGNFWVQGNPEAEGLWRHFQIEARSGFSFHNMYYQISVDLGTLGALVWFGVFGIVLLGTAYRALRRPDPAIGFFLSFMVFTFIRLFVETELLGPFDLGPILLVCAWGYATARSPVRAPAPAAPRGLPAPV